MSFDPLSICRILNQEGVDYVVLGGFATAVLGSSLPTEDIDVLPSRTNENLKRLATALKLMNAHVRTSGEPVPVSIDAGFLEQMTVVLNLVTDFGMIDLTFTPTGPKPDYASWEIDASDEEIADSLRIRVASLEDIIASKEAAGRDKDLRALPYLRSLKDLPKDVE